MQLCREEAVGDLNDWTNSALTLATKHYLMLMGAAEQAVSSSATC